MGKIYVYLLLFTLGSSLCAGAKEELSLSKLAPAPKPDGMPEQPALLKSRSVTRDGVRLWKFSSPSGAIYVPASESFSPDQLADAICTDRAPRPGAPESDMAESKPLLQDQIVNYEGAIKATIVSRCSEPKQTADASPPVNPLLENGSKGRDSNVFSRRGSRPNLNVGKSF